MVHIRKIKVGKDVDLDKIAGLTNGFTGADLANLINEAAIAATMRKANEVCFDDFAVVIERIVVGIKKKSGVLSKFGSGTAPTREGKWKPDVLAGPAPRYASEVMGVYHDKVRKLGKKIRKLDTVELKGCAFESRS